MKRRTSFAALLLLAFTADAARAGNGVDSSSGSKGDNAPTSDQVPPSAPAVTLAVIGFTSANAGVIRAQKPALDERLAFLTDSAGVGVSVELAKASAGSLVTVEERVAATADGLGLVQGPMGHRVINMRRATLTATYVNAWVGVGPVRAAAQDDNMALVEALGNRGILLRYTNARGAVLSFSFVPTSNGQAVFEGLVWVTEGKTTTEVALDAATGLLPLPTGADGRATSAARVYAFFGVAP